MCADGRSGGDGWQTKKSKTWVSGKVREEKVLAEAVTIDGRKEWICNSASNPMCGRGGGAVGVAQIFRQGCKGSTDRPLSAKAGAFPSGSSWPE